MKRGRILLADDHALILEGFRTILGPHYDIVGAVTDGLSLIEAALKSKPDLIILDVTMPLLNGIKAAGQIRKKLPGSSSYSLRCTPARHICKQRFT
jgi:DNA-binding NarL/FixJ family response regulator